MRLNNILELGEVVKTLCPICSEIREPGRCGNCRGTGRNDTEFFEAIKHIRRQEPECPSCEGKGTCIFCGGNGWILVIS